MTSLTFRGRLAQTSIQSNNERLKKSKKVIAHIHSPLLVRVFFTHHLLLESPFSFFSLQLSRFLSLRVAQLQVLGGRFLTALVRFRFSLDVNAVSLKPRIPWARFHSPPRIRGTDKCHYCDSDVIEALL